MTVPWTADLDARLLQMRADGLSYSAIGAEINRSRDVCRSRAGFLDRKSRRTAPPKRVLWSRADLATLMRLGDASDDPKRFDAIARLLGRSRAAVKWQFNIKKRAAQKPPAATRSPAAIGPYQVPRPMPKHASLTSAFFGDPLPGRSALDRKQLSTGGPHATHH